MLLSATPLTLGIAHASMALLSLNRGVQRPMQLVVVSAVTAAVAAAVSEILIT